MDDYIKREDALNTFSNAFYSGLAAKIKSIPTADVAPVVRCKDCKWRNWETNGCDRNPCVEPWFENDFCSYGERKDNE